ncbi:MAG: threonine--tRNA ligase [Bacilli bacterium]|jgi:threonyl-tRNA synthetase
MENTLKNGFVLLKEATRDNKKNVIAMKVDDKLVDLQTEVSSDAKVTFIDDKSEEGLDILRHSAAHLLAHAVLLLYPKAKLAIGPAISDGFYYDIDFGDVTLTESDLEVIEAKMRELSKKDLSIQRFKGSKDEILSIFADNPYKTELISEIEGEFSYYKQGEFLDLCMGPHVPSTRYIKHFKLLSLAGAYWRGDSRNKQLTRIYGTAFFSKEELDNYLIKLEEAKKRDHRKLGKQLDLFMLSEYGPGFPFWLPNGVTLYHELEEFWYKKHVEHGYEFIKTPTVLNRELWETSGHWFNYKENMYTLKIDERDFAIKPMNCPGAILVYKNNLYSYKDFPLRLAELGTVHRHEASGALSGLFRVRAFTQDDAHIFLRKDQLEQEIISLLHLYEEFYKTFNLSYTIELSTRPEEKYIGEIALWDLSEEILEKALIKTKTPYKINPGDGAFYGPKLDFKVKDSLGRVWQCGTIQLDMNLPERFDLTYIGPNNVKERPIMLHRAIFGSLERFIGILIEHFAGAFPLWLAPTQVVVLPVNNEFHLDYATKVVNNLKKEGIRAVLDDSNEKLGYRLRNSQVKKAPLTLVIGDNEVSDNSVTYRRYSKKEQITVSSKEFFKMIRKEIDNKEIIE